MDATLETLLKIGLILLTVGTGAGYIGFRSKVAKLIDEAGDLLADMYAFLLDIIGGKCDMTKALEIKKEVEVVWRDLEELAPFVAKISAEKSAMTKKGSQ